jgi:phosphatidylglycerophosphate synthase
MNDNRKNKPDFQKSLKSAHPYPVINYFRVERYISRPLASLIVRAVFHTSVTPNQVSYISFFLGIASGFAFFGASRFYFALGGILAFLSSVFDCADGMLARSRHQGTPYGTYLDLFLDRIADFFILAGLCTGFYRYSHNLNLFIAGLIGLGLYFLQVSLYYLINQFKQTKRTGDAAEARGLSLFVLMLLSVLNVLQLFILILIVAPVINISYKIVYFTGKARKESQPFKS